MKLLKTIAAVSVLAVSTASFGETTTTPWVAAADGQSASTMSFAPAVTVFSVVSKDNPKDFYMSLDITGYSCNFVGYKERNATFNGKLVKTAFRCSGQYFMYRASSDSDNSIIWNEFVKSNKVTVHFENTKPSSSFDISADRFNATAGQLGKKQKYNF